MVQPVDKQQKSAKAPKLSAPGNCSAFIATGSMTKDHQIVIAHNNWTSYLSGERWVMIFDIVPEHGNRILMDGFPGVITSDDDFGVNSAGIMITETTITGAMCSRLWHCRTYRRSDLRSACEECGFEWAREHWFSKLHRMLHLGGIIVELKRK